MIKESNQLLTPAYFYILLSLSLKPRHGYEIMKQVKIDSQGQINLGPGTLYGAIKKMLEERLIKEMKDKNTQRRRYYSTSQKGSRVLAFELQRYQQALEIAKRGNILPNFNVKLVI